MPGVANISFTELATVANSIFVPGKALRCQRRRHDHPPKGRCVPNLNLILQAVAELFLGCPFLSTFPDGAAL